MQVTVWPSKIRKDDVVVGYEREGKVRKVKVGKVPVDVDTQREPLSFGRWERVVVERS